MSIEKTFDKLPLRRSKRLYRSKKSG